MSKRFWLGIAAATLVAVGSVLVGFLVYAEDREDLEQRQRDEATRAAHQMEAVAGLSVGQLTSAAAFFKAEDDLSRHEFQVYGRSLVRQGALAGAVYLPRVPAEKRARYERTHGLEILERTGPLSFRRARPQPAYFPITYVAAEKEERRRALGYDLGQDPERAMYLFRARDTGTAVSSSVIPLLIGGRGINVFRAVYRDGPPVRTVAQRRRALSGFAAGSFRIDDLAAAANEAVSPGVRLQLRAGGETVFGAQGELSDGASTPLQIADQTWVLSVEDPGGPDHSLPIALAVLGISLAALLGALILSWSRKERMQELERQASQDALTGLDNRRRFERDLATAMARARRDRSTGALLILDIDDFKRVNDSQGHPAGDRLIQGVASVLRRRTRQSDTLARLGGDEFAVILPRCSREEAQLAAEAIAREVREYRSGEDSEPVTVSVGVAMFGDDPRTSAATVFSEADTAMYTAKDEGRDGVRVFDPSGT
ncbi:MAG: diguanylate cyclase [Actinomycetota bacterium]|nr:diguanylate cyclase [Actinomycetota bacterium]